MRHDLEGIGEAHQPGPAPMSTGTTKGQCTVVKPGAMAHASAAAIESPPGAENGVEKTRAEPGITLGLVHAEVVLAAARAHAHESHRACAEIGDARQVD